MKAYYRKILTATFINMVNLTDIFLLFKDLFVSRNRRVGDAERIHRNISATGTPNQKHAGPGGGR